MIAGVLPEAQIDRFRDDVGRIAGGAPGDAMPAGEPRLGLAVSGGPDSMAMLALAAAAFRGRIAVATVDHGLRDGSGAEAAMVADACASLEIPHATLRPDAPIAGSSIQHRARAARYAALAGWARDAGVHAVLTAHHADDQAETLLMRLNRSSGLSGLAAIRAARREGDMLLLRPLLRWRRAELHVIAGVAGLPVVDDPTNHDPRHDRTGTRALLAATPALDPVALAASAGFLGEAEEVVALAAQRLWAARWCGADRSLDVAGEPRELRRRLLRRAIASVRDSIGIALPPFGESANVEPLLDTLERGLAAVHGGVLVRPGPAGWTFAPAPPRRSH